MSNHLAIATVTAALKKRLENALTVDFTDTDISVTVNHARPAASSNGETPEPGLNIFLYQATPNGALASVNLPSRGAGGQLVRRPSAAIDLHYLLTFYGDETKLVPQRILGSVLRTLESSPVVTRNLINKVTSDEQFVYLKESDLAQAAETVKFIPESLSLEEMSKLWSVFFETPYALSVAYRASAVVIEAAGTPGQVLPVAERNIFVMPSGSDTAAFSPDKIPGLQLWCKSDAGLTYRSDGVSIWADQSGHGHDAIQNSVARRPQLVAHGLGGKPVLRFDGVDDDLAIQNLSYSGSGEIGQITVWALVRSKASQAQVIVSFARDQFWQLALHGAADTQPGWQTADAAGVVHDLHVADSFADGRWHLICARFAAGADPDKQVFVDGVEVIKATAHAGNRLGRGNPRFGFVGAGSAATVVDGDREPDTHFSGDLAEILIFHHALSDAERAQLERYFVNRYRS